MMDFDEQIAVIRKFLLGQLSEEMAEQLEERIFVEPDFAEEVQIIEDELITDYRLGNLNPTERSFFERKYLTSPASRRAIEDDSAFSEFIHTKSERNEFPPDNRLATSEGFISGTETKTALPQEEKLKRKGWLSRLYSLFTTRSVITYSMLAASLLLAVGLWQLLGWYSSRRAGSDPSQAEQRTIEEELARLNSDAATARDKEVTTLDLKPTLRDGKAMPRIAIDKNNQNRLIEFRLRIMQGGSQHYRALFLDDRQNKLFAIPNLTAQDTPDGPQVRLLVPTRYLKRGDYQINLSVLDKSGSYEEINSYAFRIAETK